MFILAVVIILIFYALIDLTGWLNMPLPGSRWGKMEHTVSVLIAAPRIIESRHGLYA